MYQSDSRDLCQNVLLIVETIEQLKAAELVEIAVKNVVCISFLSMLLPRCKKSEETPYKVCTKECRTDCVQRSRNERSFFYADRKD